MARAYIGLGSNLDQPEQHLRRAARALATLPRSELLACSPFYRSEPVGPPGQPDYINAAAAIATEFAPLELLAALHAIERAHGRVRGVRWGPRTLDLDLLLYDDLQLNHARLTLPHPRLHERAFVLQPLYDLAPELVIPGRGALATLLRASPPLRLERLP